MKFESVKILNFIYSLVIGLVSGFASRNYTKYSVLLGVLMALISYYANKKLLLPEQDSWFLTYFFISLHHHSLIQLAVNPLFISAFALLTSCCIFSLSYINLILVSLLLMFLIFSCFCCFIQYEVGISIGPFTNFINLNEHHSIPF